MILAEREIAGPGPERGVVFQNHSLLPWLTCTGNVHLAVERVFGEREPKSRLAARTRRHAAPGRRPRCAGARAPGAGGVCGGGEPKSRLAARTRDALALVGLAHAASKYP